MIQITLSRRFLVALAACAVFALGCAARPFIVPPANAGQAVRKWEHFCFGVLTPKEATERANAAGLQGFEMASSSGVNGQHRHYCMKRPL